VPDVPNGENSLGTAQSTEPYEENDAVPDVPDQTGSETNIHARGNGADHDQRVDAAPVDDRCGFCGSPMNGVSGVMHDGKVFHIEACLAEHLKKAGPPA
jgi:hypothetical protein